MKFELATGPALRPARPASPASASERLDEQVAAQPQQHQERADADGPWTEGNAIELVEAPAHNHDASVNVPVHPAQDNPQGTSASKETERLRQPTPPERHRGEEHGGDEEGQSGRGGAQPRRELGKSPDCPPDTEPDEPSRHPAKGRPRRYPDGLRMTPASALTFPYRGRGDAA
jgi:hypothetical protein